MQLYNALVKIKEFNPEEIIKTIKAEMGTHIKSADSTIADGLVEAKNIFGEFKIKIKKVAEIKKGLDERVSIDTKNNRNCE